MWLTMTLSNGCNMTKLFIETARQIKSEYWDEIRANDWGRDLKVLVLTNVENDSLKQKLYTMGVVDYLLKINTTLTKLADTVDSILSTDQTVS